MEKLQRVIQSLQLQHFTLNEFLIKYVMSVLVYLVNEGSSQKLSMAGPNTLNLSKYPKYHWQGYSESIFQLHISFSI